MLTFEEKLKLVRINSFLGKGSLDLLSELAAAAVEHFFDTGEFIFSKHDPATEFYVLVDGRVGHPEIRASRAYRPVAHEVTACGQIFGFAGAVQGRPTRVASARCEAPTRVLRVDGRWFQRLCSDKGPNGYALLGELVRAHAGYEHTVLGRQGWVSVRNAGKVYGTGPKGVLAVDDCSFELRAGECCAILGKHGCGKTTLAGLVTGRDRMTSGAIYLDGELLNWPGAKPKARSELAIAPLRTLSPRITLRANLLQAAQGARDEDTPADKLDNLLARLGLSSLASCYPHEVSASTVRSIEILSPLLNEPQVVIFDEPSRGLDAPGKTALGAFLLELFEVIDSTVLLLTEDVDEAVHLADRVLVMSGQPGSIIQTKFVDLPRPRTDDVLAAADCQQLKHELLEALQAGASGRQSPSAAAELPVLNFTEILKREHEERKAERQTGITSASGSSTPVNSIKDSLRNSRFFWTIEFIPSVDKVLRDELHRLGGIAEAMRGEPVLAGFAVADRVHSDRDPDPVAAAAHLLSHCGKQPLVHFSGKDRDTEDLFEAIEHMASNRLENMLLITGDRLKQEPRDRRPRYLESVPAILTAKRTMPGLIIAAALNPFKYREEDAMAQYLKLGKKVGAGADYIITQIGFDMRKYEEALFWVDTRNYRVPLVANVMPLSAARARYIRRRQLAGVTVTDSFLALLEAEERLLPDKGVSRVLRRLALQILGVRLYGYTGIQITGLHSMEKLSELRDQVTALADLCADRINWNRAWEESLTLPDGGGADPAPTHDPWYLVNQRTGHARVREKWKYRAMNGVHALAFDRGLAAHIVAPLFRPVKRHGNVDALLERLERVIKAPLFGCETCGLCRLAATQYVCPETCPKGLANGACGGTTANLCEFRDRECIHSVKYRLAKDVAALEQLETWLIPAVPQHARGTSSWPPHFRGEGPQVIHVDFVGKKAEVSSVDDLAIRIG